MKIQKIKIIHLKDGIVYNPYTNTTEKASILIEDGLIKKIGKVSSSNNEIVIDCKDKIIAPGFIDLHAHFREPGREDKETLKSGALSALSGGYTKVCVMPNTDPPLDTPESIRFIIEKSSNLPIQIFPIGAVTKGQDGKEMTEIGKMVYEGAVAISDDGLPIQNGQVLRNAIEYAKQFNIPLINHAEDVHLRNEGIINEGIVSTKLGLPGIPDISESIMVHRDLEIAEYCNGKIHIPHVSTKKSVDLIRRYKKIGVKVTAEVTPHHIGLSENDLLSYNTDAKVAPPLRSEADRLALIKGIKDGTIDCIATDHAPHTIEEKERDIIHAPCGMIGLESAFAMSHTILSKSNLSIEKIIDLFTKNPAEIMGWNLNPLIEKNIAELVIIDPKLEWTFKRDDIVSKSSNSPMVGKKFMGKVLGTISGKSSFGSSFKNLTS